MKKIIFMSMVAFMAISLAGYSQVPPRPNPARLVNDVIGILSPDVRDNLEQQLVQYDNATSIQIAVVIVNDAVADGSDEAIEIGNTWGVGQKELDNGVVFFIAIASKKMFIAVGPGLEGDLTDLTCHHICEDAVKPHLKDGNYAQGIQAGIDEIRKTLTTVSWNERTRLKEEQARQDKLAQQELISIISGIAIILAILGLFFWILYSTARKSKRVAKKVKELRTYYANIVADEVESDPLWPKWAKKDSSDLFEQYTACKEECIALLATLPKFFLTRLFANEKKFALIETKLEAYDEVDRTLTKIRDDVKLYDTRAVQAIADTQKLADTVLERITAGGTKYNFSRERAALETIQREIAEKLVITDGDSKRACFRLAYTLAEQLTLLEKNIRAEMDAEKDVAADISSFLKKQKLFPQRYADYQTLLKKLSAYPSTVMNGIDTPSMLKNRMDRIDDMIANVKQKVAGSAPGVYADALLRTVAIAELISKVETIYATASGRVDALAEKQKSYPGTLADVQATVVKAEKEVKDSDVGTSARNLARDARSKLATAERLADAAKVDWILVHETLADAEEDAKVAIKKAKSDKSDASNRRSSNSTSSYSSSYSGSDSSSSFDSSGTISFGGFGGGSFDGGGGGSSW
jgi:uncharacterized protein